jgi:hypothetical protein
MEEFDKRFGNDFRTSLPAQDESRQVDVHEAFRRFSTRIKHFHPKLKPVLWRIMIAQVVLYRVLDKMQKDRNFTGSDLRSYLDSLKNDKQIVTT